ncbi:MAG: lipopolysaccharide kinase InaA family protein, partial [Flavobacterium sp.]
MKIYFHPNHSAIQSTVENILRDFDGQGDFLRGGRNTIKVFTLENNQRINVKSFKKPNIINRFVYCYFRKSKAERSFKYAMQLLEKGVRTPQPIAYAENKTLWGLRESYYVSEQLDCDLTFRELVLNPGFPDYDTILLQFTRFSFGLHQKGIEFLDHSPGNTLIKKQPDGNYDFYLVDLNRMKFHDSISFDTRMRNLSHLTHREDMILTISEEYAKLSGEDP